MIDYARLREQTLGSGQDEEAVTVNTRALIDKVLARYSGEWTTLRELIQNAADASATQVKIKFETLPSSSTPVPKITDPSAQLKHTVVHHTLHRLLVSNNGQAFQESDWSRLKRIAEGNPDESKIGAFGVGFYSVFAECETPFVSSGYETMAFYWKGSSLFTRKGKIPTELSNTETCFVLDYRNTTSTIPNLMSICQFLSTSLTFVGLESIELWIDDWSVFTLRKKSAPSTTVSIPKSLDTKTKEGLMRITGVECQNAQIDATWINVVGWTPSINEIRPIQTLDTGERGNSAPSLRSFLSRLAGASQNNAAAKRAAKEEEAAQRAISEDVVGISQATVFIRVNTVWIKSQVSNAFAGELERATKKPPPKQTRISVLTSSYDETTASLSTLTGTAANKAAEIITSVLPTKAGRVFIGFPTAQTSGLLAHISAPSLIPTVERESIDLNARYVRTWNTELLNVAGIACRIAYVGEMAALREKISTVMSAAGSAVIGDAEIAAVLPAAVHALKQYTFSESTPLSKAGQIIEESFWTCNSKASIEILSSRGILPSHEVRIASEDLSFVKGLPIIPEPLLTESHDFVMKLREFGFISEITTSDIKRELEKQSLNEDQLSEFLRWAALKIKSGQIEPALVRSLLESTIATIDSGSDNIAVPRNHLLVLQDVSSYINSSRLTPELPMPSHTIPFRFTKGLSQVEMQSFGWEELQLIPWLRWLLEQANIKGASHEQDPSVSPAFAAQILALISRSWDSLSQSSKSTVIELLTVRTIIPTKLGMRRPAESYFGSVKLFDDLPTVTSLSGVKEKFLKALGVRKTIDLAVIFDRLMTKTAIGDEGATKWNHVDLIRYLVSVWDDIPAADIAQLHDTALCPAEKDGDPKKSTSRHYKISELFEPKDSLRALGLSILQWPGLFNAYSSDGKFLKLLGLRGYPSVPELVKIMRQAHAGQNVLLFETTLKYFIENHYQNNYGAFDFGYVDLPFLPLDGDNGQKLVKPDQCYTDAKVKVLGYQILRQDLHSHAAKFGVRADPPIADCAVRLISQPPQTRAEAKQSFTYFAGRLTDISNVVAEKLGSAAIVPINKTKTQYGLPSEKGSRLCMATPQSCFLGDGDDYSEIFDYVDFGPEANLFLLKVGCKHEPSTAELTRLLIRQPGRTLQALGVEKYLNLLRKLYVNMTNLKKDKALWKDMRQAPFLLAYKLRPLHPKTNISTQPIDVEIDTFDEDSEEMAREYHLRSADKVILVDDLISYTLFKEHLFAAPDEEPLEELYAALGVPWISALVDEEPRLGPRISDQSEAANLRELILERAQLFLYEQPRVTVLHDVKWLEKNLEVQIVQSLSLRRTLRDRSLSHVEKRSAAINPSGKNKAVLCITTKFDVWQVSREIVSLLIDRAKTQTVMVFETFLVTNLYKLRARGYNVDRILRRKAAEARMAEAERQNLQVEEIRRAEEQQPPQHTPKSQHHDSDQEQHVSPSPIMPGAFHDSPDRVATAPKQLTQLPGQRKPRGLFSSLTRHLGFDEQNTPSQDLQNFLGGGHMATVEQGRPENRLAPPPYSSYDPQQPSGSRNPDVVMAPNKVQKTLQSAINASRAYGSSNLFSRPETSQVEEVSSYCDNRPGQNLSFVATSTPGLHIYISNTSTDCNNFLTENRSGLDAFASLLINAGSVFPVAAATLHVYYDENGSTMAFNSQGSLFFNYRFFAQLQLNGMNDPRAKAQALVYWWVILCHELAHNLIDSHSSDHSFYTEQFVAMYFPAVAGRMAEMAMGNNSRVEGENSGAGGRALMPSLGPFA